MSGQLYEINFGFFRFTLVPFFYGYQPVFLEGKLFAAFLPLGRGSFVMFF
jgi:hypothetical protein